MNVTKESDDFKDTFCGCNVIENCVDCGTRTSYWAFRGVFPLCPACAPTWTSKRALKFAKKEGYGPIELLKLEGRHENHS